MVKKIIKKVESVQSEVTDKLSTLMISAFGLVAALSWNDAIKALISAYLPAQQTWPFMMLNASLVTAIAVIVTFVASRLKEKKPS